MSTRATVHFKQSAKSKSEAIIYRHSDGYPEGLGKDLAKFFEEVKRQTSDTRFNDPTYLAAKWVVWDSSKGEKVKGRLDFLGVGVVSDDPGDIEYRYTVVCDGKPTVTHEEV